MLSNPNKSDNYKVFSRSVVLLSIVTLSGLTGMATAANTATDSTTLTATEISEVGISGALADLALSAPSAGSATSAVTDANTTLSITSLVDSTETRSVTASLSAAAPTGTALTLAATAPSGTGDCGSGSSAQELLNGSSITVLSSIESCYASSTLTYSFNVDDWANVVSGSSNPTITFTMTATD